MKTLKEYLQSEIKELKTMLSDGEKIELKQWTDDPCFEVSSSLLEISSLINYFDYVCDIEEKAQNFDAIIKIMSLAQNQIKR